MEEFVTIKEVVKKLKTSRQSVLDLTKSNKITAYRLGKRSVRYKAREIEAYMESQAITPANEPANA